MTILFNNVFVISSIVLYLPNGLVGLASDSQDYRERVMVSCSPGKGPGQFILEEEAGSNLSPRCFGIDPNNGDFYIPEADSYANIRVHRFDRNGNFINMIHTEGKTGAVINIGISPKRDIYMCLTVPGVAESYIGKYDGNGKLLFCLGALGKIESIDLDMDNVNRKPFAKIDSIRADSFFFTANEVIIKTGYGRKKMSVYRYHSNTGQLVEMSKDIKVLSSEIVQKIDLRVQQYDKLSAILSESNRLRGLSHFLIGPDNGFYYMSVMPERLEIRKVIFDE